jgi:hypothetical protein
VGPSAGAQEAKVPNWDAMRKAGIVSIDRNTTQRWLDAQIQKLLALEDAKAAQKDGTAFYKEMIKQYTAGDAAQPFKDSLADLLAASLTNNYQPAAAAKPPRPLAVSLVLMALRDFAHPSAQPCFRAALNDPAPGPRFVAADGLLAIQKALTNQDWAALVPLMQKAAAQETNNPTLSRIYSVLFAAGADNNRVQNVIAAIMTALDNRCQQLYEEKGILPLKADGEALAWVADRAERGNDAAARLGATRRAARVLADAVYAYLNEKPGNEQRQELEELIIQVETRLEGLVRVVNRNVKLPDPTVRAAMLAGGPERNKKMEAARDQWVGSGQSPGVLNAAPFDFPVGLGIKRPMPATSTAAAGG